MLYEEYLFLSGYILSLLLFVYAVILQRKNRAFKLKLKKIGDVEEASQKIIFHAHKEEEMILHEAYLKLNDVKEDLEINKRRNNKILLSIEQLKDDYQKKRTVYLDLSKEINTLHEMQEYYEIGFKDFKFEFDDQEEYKNAIGEVRNKQKEMVKDKEAVMCSTTWTVNGSPREGLKMVNMNIKLTLRAFNSECDVIISRINWKNFTQSSEKIRNAFDFFNNYNKTNSIIISPDYLGLKLEELRLTFENQEKKQQVKEEQRAIREQIREEERFEKDRIAAEKEEEKYQRLLKKAQEEVEKASGGRLIELTEDVEKLTAALKEAQEKNQRALSMAQQTKAGHVYVISNIGSFGDDVFKIGMTRRLDPFERIYELGGASVPFEFDVHAMIPSNDAPGLESKLHNAFEKYKMNLVNNRREFFKLPLDEIESEVKKDSPDSEFIKTALAEQYRKSEALRRQFVTTQNIIEYHEFPDSI